MRKTIILTLLLPTLAACSQNSRSILVETCLADGSPRHTCVCNSDAIAGGLPKEAVDRMAHFMARKDARGLNRAMAIIGSNYPAETKAIIQKVATCSGPNTSVRSWPVERDRDEPQRLDTDPRDESADSPQDEQILTTPQ